MERTTVAGASNYPTVSARFIIPPSGRPEATRIVSKHLGCFFYYLLFRRRKASASLVFLAWAPGDVSAGKMSALTARPRYLFFLSFRLSPNCKCSPLCVRQGSLPSASLSRQCAKDLGQWHWNSAGLRFAPSTEGKHTWTQTSIHFPPLFKVSQGAGRWHPQ